jgi:hypothetical protein
MTLRHARNDRMDATDRAELMQKADPKDPIEPIEQAEPTEPIEQEEPIEPIESTEPLDAIERNEPSDQSDHFDVFQRASAVTPRIVIPRRHPRVISVMAIRVASALRICSWRIASWCTA